MAGSSFQFSDPGAGTFAGFVAATPSGVSPTTGSGIPAPQFKPGTVVMGDRESEFVLVALTLAAVTTLTPGDVYQWDKDYNASIVTTASAVRGYRAGVVVAYQYNLAAGTYYGWLQRAGNGPVKSAGIANGAGETTTTAGQANFAASPTTGAKSLQGLLSYLASLTFTGNITNGSNQVTGVSQAALADLYVGTTVSATGLASSTITAIDTQKGVLTVSNNATATTTGVTVTATGVLTGNIGWPYVDKTN